MWRFANNILHFKAKDHINELMFGCLLSLVSLSQSKNVSIKDKYTYILSILEMSQQQSPNTFCISNFNVPFSRGCRVIWDGTWQTKASDHWFTVHSFTNFLFVYSPLACTKYMCFFWCPQLINPQHVTLSTRGVTKRQIKWAKTPTHTQRLAHPHSEQAVLLTLSGFILASH